MRSPRTTNRKQPLFIATRENPLAATKIQHRQKRNNKQINKIFKNIHQSRKLYGHNTHKNYRLYSDFTTFTCIHVCVSTHVYACLCNFIPYIDSSNNHFKRETEFYPLLPRNSFMLLPPSHPCPWLPLVCTSSLELCHFKNVIHYGITHYETSRDCLFSDSA